MCISCTVHTLGKKKKNNSEKWMGSLCVHTYCYKTHQTEETTLLRKKNKTWEKKKLPFSNQLMVESKMA